MEGSAGGGELESGSWFLSQAVHEPWSYTDHESVASHCFLTCFTDLVSGASVPRWEQQEQHVGYVQDTILRKCSDVCVTNREVLMLTHLTRVQLPPCNMQPLGLCLIFFNALTGVVIGGQRKQNQITFRSDVNQEISAFKASSLVSSE